MRKAIYILCLLLVCTGLQAKKTKKTEQTTHFTIHRIMTPEEEQRFLYYFYEMARLYANEDYERAFQLAEFCCYLNPYDPVVNTYMGDYYAEWWKPKEKFYYNGEYYVKESPLDKAILYYERAYFMDPNNESLPYRMEQVYSELHNTDRALRLLDEIDRRDGQSEYTAYRRFRHYVSLGADDLAMQTVEDYLRRNPYSERFQLLRIEVYEALKVKYKKKVRAYREALQVLPDYPMLLNNYAYMLATRAKKGRKGLERLKEAEAYSREAIRQEPQNGIYLDTYAWILYLLGEKKLALMYIKSALDKFDFNDIPAEVNRHFWKITNDQ